MISQNRQATSYGESLVFGLHSKESDWKSYVERPIADWKNIWNTFITVFAVVFLRMQMKLKELKEFVQYYILKAK